MSARSKRKTTIKNQGSHLEVSGLTIVDMTVLLELNNFGVHLSECVALETDLFVELVVGD